MIKLKPCPFCGGTAVYHEIKNRGRWHVVRCENEYCKMRPSTYGCTTPDAAAAIWTRREGA